MPLIRSVTGKPVCGGSGVDGVEAGSGVAGGTALVNGAVVASSPTEPSRERKARREEEPNPEGASVPSPLFLLILSDIVSQFGSGCGGKLVSPPKGSQLHSRLPLAFHLQVTARTSLSRFARYRRRRRVAVAILRSLLDSCVKGTAKKHEERPQPQMDSDLRR